jgi:hypothetical protein
MSSEFIPMSETNHQNSDGASVVMLSGAKVIVACALTAAVLFAAGRVVELPLGLLAGEVFATILGLFLFGSFKYQIHKNALTYGMSLVIVATFCGLANSQWHSEIAASGWWPWARENLLSFHGLDDVIHADTMLFILGLTFFVAVIAQTRLLEGITFFLLRRYRGHILPTVISVTAVVALASGILDGVSMIGLTIRTLVIILMLAAAPTAAIRYAVMVCTAVTTVCGIWLAYGEPPNLIMKANLHPYLDNAFFLRYCAPAAIGCYLVIAWKLKRKMGGGRIRLDAMDVIDANAEDVRFLQASRHGEVLSGIELVEGSPWCTRMFPKRREKNCSASSLATNWQNHSTTTTCSMLAGITTTPGKPSEPSTRPSPASPGGASGRKESVLWRCYLSSDC